MTAQHRILGMVLIGASIIVAPSLASAQDNRFPGTNIPIPDLQEYGLPSIGELQDLPMPNVQQVPGGFQVLIPGMGNVVINDQGGIYTPPAATPNPPSYPAPIYPQPAPSYPQPAPSYPQPAPNYPQANPAPTYPPAVPAIPSPADPGSAQPGQGGRVVGVFVGITNYPSGNDLPHCADDARLLASAFVSAGIISQSEAIVLTDHQATRGNVANAIRRLGSTLSQNDTLVFFFSGHGDRRADDNGDELDGQDETIILSDGALLDDELVGYLQAARGRDFLALDSCYAGGFQQDLARVQHSVGFYSSTENETSAVASEFNSGGYLSHFMTTGIQGSRGRQLQVWNLQQHIQQGYLTSGANGRQNLVVGVGPGVSNQTVLFPRNEHPRAYASR